MEGDAAARKYVDTIEGATRVAGSRVSLDSIVYAFWGGQPAESIAQSFPTLTLEEVYGAIAFYLAHAEEVDAYLERQAAEYEVARDAARKAAPSLHEKLAAARAGREGVGSKRVA